MKLSPCLLGVAVAFVLQRYPRCLSITDPILLGLPQMTSDRTICRFFGGEEQDAEQVTVGTIPRHRSCRISGWLIITNYGWSGSLLPLQDFCRRKMMDGEDHSEFVFVFLKVGLLSSSIGQSFHTSRTPSAIMALFVVLLQLYEYR